MARARHVQDPPPERRLKAVPDFGDNPGALRMFAWAPPQLEPHGPLVVTLHGCGQSAQSFALDAGWLELGERLGFAVVAPEQTRANNPGRCFNWFEAADRMRGGGEAASIAAMVDQACAMFRADRARVFAVGLSAGGCMALNLMAAYPDLFEAGAVVAAAPYGSASSLREAMMAMMAAPIDDAARLAELARRAAPGAPRRPRLSVWYGAADPTVSAMNGPAIADQWRTLLGLPAAPDLVERAGRLVRHAWRTAGQVQVELNRVEGLGHGAPIDTRASGAVGRRAPYVIDAGVSSTLEIARFFGLDAARGARRIAEPRSEQGRPLAGLLERLRLRRR